jgi:hypothetical protein
MNSKFSTLGIVFICCATFAHTSEFSFSTHGSQVERGQKQGQKQGGEDWGTATEISIPFATTGTTVGYSDDIGHTCIMPIGSSPDVVYEFLATETRELDVDLAGSNFDTVLLVWRYDASQSPPYVFHDCDLDGNGSDLTSHIRDLEVVAGERYFIVVDGFWGTTGLYHLAVSDYEDCELLCSGLDEGEPSLENGYQDAYNGGCNSPEFGEPFQELFGDENGDLVLCGVGGWYVLAGDDLRDTDWFRGTIGSDGVVEVDLASEVEVNLFDLGPLDCGEVGILQSVAVSACDEASLTIIGEPGQEIWLWIGSSWYLQPDWYDDQEFDYVLSISGLAAGTVATERHSLSDLKGLFR